ncbi:hypothetical protein [Methylobacterium sp. J-070]|uniref:hypothetical protein n=1 Tax=Methylobacterium sp. J-070 TaxID=2836650 RepID=UPI001FB8FFF1|nr:hypothetical protein [Methylobacterium sp. J-070]MCJ2052954.1 hypothetical protein [Methylobacterium sp. J-070]
MSTDFGLLPVTSPSAGHPGVPPVQRAPFGPRTTARPVSPQRPAILRVCGPTGIDCAGEQESTGPVRLRPPG